MEIKRNPFYYGGDLRARDLVDRVGETAQVEATIRNGEKLFLIGPRRFGKTSILRAAEENLTAAGAIVLRLNTETYPTLDMLVEKIVATAAARMKGKVDLVVSQLRRFFSNLRPELKFNVTEHEWSVSLGVSTPSNSKHSVQLLADALDGLEKLALSQPESRPVGLILDEFQSVVMHGGIQAEAQIRSIIQEHRRVGYVFAGSQTRLMTDMTMKHNRPLYRLGASRFIGPLPRAGFAAHLKKQFRKSGFNVDNQAAIESILDLAEEVPFNVQMLAHSCWEELRSAGNSRQPKLTETLVRVALSKKIKNLDPLLTQTWTRLTTTQQKTLIAVIRENGQGMSSSAVAQSVGLSVSSVQSALNALHEQSILRDDPAAGKIHMRFEDPFFAQWIRVTVMQ